MRVIYLEHSGFLLELPRLVLVFDFYRDPAGVLSHFKRDGKPFVFFVSHEHSDHWNPDILNFQNDAPCYYICDLSLNSQLRSHKETPNRRFLLVHGNRRLTDDALAALGLFEIFCLPSTDSGVAFYLRTEVGALYHAGDLNDWDWQDGGGVEVESRYRDALLELKNHTDESDSLQVAFVPVDQRLGGKALAGAEIFCEYFTPRYLMPMHLNGGLELPKRLAASLESSGRADVCVKPMLEPGCQFEVM